MELKKKLSENGAMIAVLVVICFMSGLWLGVEISAGKIHVKKPDMELKPFEELVPQMVAKEEAGKWFIWFLAYDSEQWERINVGFETPEQAKTVIDATLAELKAKYETARKALEP